MSYSKARARCDTAFSLFIRYRDAMPSGFFRCISCGKIKPFPKADCGHYINRQHMATRFNEINCNAQCSHCNRFMEGNIQGYRRGLIAKYGESKVELLEAMQHETNKLSEFELDVMAKHYRKLARQIKKEKGL